MLDVAWSALEICGLSSPEVLGEVDDYTMMRGYVIDRVASLNQVLMSPWFSPSDGRASRNLSHDRMRARPGLWINVTSTSLEAKWVENRFMDAGCYQKSGVEEFFPSAHAGDGPILLTRAQANSILGLENDPLVLALHGLVLRYAGLPLDENGKMQVAWAQDWMEKAIQEAHREATQPEPGSNRLEARSG